MEIKIQRSESTTLRFQRKNGEGEIIFEQPNDIFFSVKKDYKDEDFVLQKKLSTGEIAFDSETGWYRIALSPKDTAELDFGIYYFDIKKREGERETYIRRMDTIEICPVITGIMEG